MRRFLSGVFLAILLMAIAIPEASASVQWCQVDPPVTIVTPKGNQVTVYVTLAGPTTYQSELEAAQISYTVKSSDGGTTTTVNMTVLVPNPPPPDKPFGATSEVGSGSFGSGTVYASTSGTSGKPMNLTFKLSVP